MVKLTVPYITKKGTPNAPKHGQDSKDHVRKLTHLYLQDQYIDEIGDISACKNLTVLYLQNNQLKKIENLEYAVNISHLYLQHNKLQKIQGFDSLKFLRKLYLGHNFIAVVEGLSKNVHLQELHIEHQHLAPGEELNFDPRTVAALGSSLEVLNLQGDGLTSLEDLVGLDILQTLNVANNRLSDITKFQAFIAAMPLLVQLEMSDNPLLGDYKNKNKIIATAQNLRVLNGKRIPAITVQFLRNLEKNQQKMSAGRLSQPSLNILESVTELAHKLPGALARDVTSRVLRNTSLTKVMDVDIATNCDEVSQQSRAASQPAEDIYYHFPAFKSSTCFQVQGHIVPRPFHRHRKAKSQERCLHNKLSVMVVGDNLHKVPRDARTEADFAILTSINEKGNISPTEGGDR